MLNSSLSSIDLAFSSSTGQDSIGYLPMGATRGGEGDRGGGVFRVDFLGVGV